MSAIVRSRVGCHRCLCLGLGRCRSRATLIAAAAGRTHSHAFSLSLCLPLALWAMQCGLWVELSVCKCVEKEWKRERRGEERRGDVHCLSHLRICLCCWLRNFVKWMQKELFIGCTYKNIHMYTSHSMCVCVCVCVPRNSIWISLDSVTEKAIGE